MMGSTFVHTAVQADNKARVMAALNAHPFRPAWWLAHRHLQTCWSPLFRRRPAVPLEHERVDTPDGDFLDLYHCQGDPGKPGVVLLHGLEGTLNSFYIPAINNVFHELGWNVTTMMFRTCGTELNRACRAYHMGETSDLAFLMNLLHERHPDRPFYIAGVSLGANVLLKWLGELNDAAPPHIRGAAAISPPFDPAAGIEQFHREFFGLYAKKFLRTLLPKALEKERQFPGCIDAQKVRACTDFYVYDTEVTARLHGYDDAWDYWRRVGCGQFLPHVRVPTLLLTSRDDPFNPAHTIPGELVEASHHLHPQWTDRGGHVGFVGGRLPWQPAYWMEAQVRRFFTAYDAIRLEQNRD
ncbi:MAG: alpha/beta fold hydrolase [Candidatus Hydrogenedentes bacterium]|nr:alpha/beta fold hydrolase [Candidatus Hydrogenedentota bacterium]